MSNPPQPPSGNLRPKPDWAMLFGAVMAIGGYLLPWFQIRKPYQWWFSGWKYTSLSHGGGGWTLTTLFWLAALVLAAAWAGRSMAAAMIGVTATVGTGFFALAVISAGFAASFASGVAHSPGTQLYYATEPVLDVGLPLLAGGLGLALAGGIRAIVRRSPRSGPS